MDMTRGEFIGLFTIAVAKLFGYKPASKKSGFTQPTAPAEPKPIIYGDMDMVAGEPIAKGDMVEVVQGDFIAQLDSKFPDDLLKDEHGRILISESISVSEAEPGIVRRSRQYADGEYIYHVLTTNDFVNCRKLQQKHSTMDVICGHSPVGVVKSVSRT